MTPEELSALIREILGNLSEENGLTTDTIPATVKVERPRSRGNGDWSTNIAMQLAKKAGIAPRDLATKITTQLDQVEGITKTEVAGPGFVNIWLEAGAAGALVGTILQAGKTYGHSQDLSGKHVNVEYVSANPTGPIHLGGGRWAAVGDTLCRILAACGAEVTREYYFNDHGAQISRFTKSLVARWQGTEVPEDGYGGQYVLDIANRVAEQAKKEGIELENRTQTQVEEYFREVGTGLMFQEIKDCLHAFRADFDVFFHEDELHTSGAVTDAIEELRSRGVIYEQDGATWLKSTKYGDDKDRVILKSDGDPAYFAADIAYYRDKQRRGATEEILILGADHHGYIDRMYAMCAAFGGQPGESLEIIIGQMVNLKENGVEVKMSKRAGTVITLDDLVDAVGVDAARYSLVRVSMDSTVDIDLDLLRSHSNENPVYYVQYAHARTCSVGRNADEAGVLADGKYDASTLSSPADNELLGILAQYPAELKLAANEREPHRIPRYLEKLAAGYHTWYNQCRVIPRSDEEITAAHVARRHLNEAVRQVLANGLELCGVVAPERM